MSDATQHTHGTSTVQYAHIDALIQSDHCDQPTYFELRWAFRDARERIAKLTESRRLYYDQWVRVTAERDALQAQVSELRALLLDAEQMLSANYASPVTVQGQRALAMVNKMRTALVGGGK